MAEAMHREPAVDIGSVLSRLSTGRRRRRRIPLVQQLTRTECGAACLSMVLSYHGREVRPGDLRDLLGAGRDGSSAKAILRGARHHGLVARGVRIELDALAHLPAASILHWGFNHFVVFERLAQKGAVLLDPALGKRTVTMAELRRSFTGVALLFEPSEHFAAAKAGARGAGLFGKLVRRAGDWGRIVTTSLFIQLLLLALPLLTGVIVDRIVPRGDGHMLAVLGIGLVGVVAFQFLASMIRAHLLLHVRTLLDARMTLGFLRHLFALPYMFFQQRSAGDLMLRLNSNTIIREILTASALSGILDGTLMGLYVLLLLVMSPVMGALVLALGALHVGLFVATRGRQREMNALLLERQARAQSYQVEIFAGIETLKAMGCEERAEERFTNLFVDVLNASLARGRLAALLEAVSSALRLGAPLLILSVGALMVLNGQLSLGAMLALDALAVSVFGPLSGLVTTAVQLQTLGSYMERIADIHETPLEQDPAAVRPSGKLMGRIELDGVSFRYRPLEPLVVEDVSVTIAPGQLVAIVGRSGSGKSTLASLLLGLYRPTSGTIAYDGVDQGELDLRSVRRQLGIVTQRAYIFGSTLRANIALSDPEMPLEEVVRAAKRARIHDEIMQMPMAYDTLLTDGGGSLSGGQRQRIALARALSQGPAILLLDEATSALDAITEREVQAELSRLSCTRIIIAHRLSTIVDADVILVMDEGRLVERGTHAELLAKEGTYADLVATQLSHGRE